MFHRFSGLTIIAILILFFLGGLVRVTGAGMGCPDWPKCFGSWVPPTSESQLPTNYEEIYNEKRKSKINRLIGFLDKIGMHQKATEIAGTSGLSIAHVFNFSKAYTEYVNRLMGALTGILALLAGYFSLIYRKSSPRKVVFTFVGIFFIVLNGWLGSLVVDSNLFGGMVTVHFIIAFLAIAFFMLGYSEAQDSIAGESTLRSRIPLSILALCLGILQLVSGTMVRENVDTLNTMGTLIDINNFALLGNTFNLHRITAPILAAVLIILWITHRRHTNRTSINRIYLGIFILLLMQVVTGILNIRLTFPPVVQLLHVVAGSLVVSGLIFTNIHEFKIQRPA